MALFFTSDGPAPLKIVCRRSRAFVRASPVEKSSAMAFASGCAVACCFASSSAHPPAMPSFMRPHRPLGSAAVIAAAATIGAARMWLHSSELKALLLAIVVSPSRRVDNLCWLASFQRVWLSFVESKTHTPKASRRVCGRTPRGCVDHLWPSNHDAQLLEASQLGARCQLVGLTLAGLESASSICARLSV